MQNAVVPLVQIQTIVDPAATLGAIGVSPEVDVTLADDGQLSVLTEQMNAAGYIFVGTSPAANNPPKGRASVIDVPNLALEPPASAAGETRLYCDTSSGLIRTSESASAFGPLVPVQSNRFLSISEDWISGTVAGSYAWITTASGAGSGATQVGVAGTTLLHFGVVQISTGATATGRTALSLLTATGFVLDGAGAASYECEIGAQIPLVSTVAETFEFITGFGNNNVAGVQTNQITFIHDGTSPNWILRCSSTITGLTTSVVTATPVASGAWVRLGFRKLTGTAAVNFFINGVLVGSIATNVPGGIVAPLSRIVKSVGIVPRTAWLDWYNLVYSFNASRI
jgi:hypothetical protein